MSVVGGARRVLHRLRSRSHSVWRWRIRGARDQLCGAVARSAAGGDVDGAAPDDWVRSMPTHIAKAWARDGEYQTVVRPHVLEGRCSRVRRDLLRGASGARDASVFEVMRGREVPRIRFELPSEARGEGRRVT